MLKALKIRIYPTKDQEFYISKLFGSYRFVYNKCLDLKISEYTNNKKNIGLSELGNYLHQDLTKNPEFNWLKEHNSKVLMQSIINLLDSYKRFFVNGNGFPKFKSKRDNQSCRFPLQAISKTNEFNNKITLTKQLKNIKFKTSEKYVNYLKTYKDNIRNATLSKNNSGKYFLSILIDLPDNKTIIKPINDFIGLDLGIKDFIVDSKGNKYENLKSIRNNEYKLKKLQKQHSKKLKGSKNREKSRNKLAKVHERLTNIKQNYLHHISNKIINENQVIVLETLNVKGMMSNHNLAKSIQELSLYDFKTKVKYKAVWNERDIVEIDMFYPSSKLCSCCGHKNTELTLRDRTWICPSCKTVHDRDFNASTNIENEGRRLYKIKNKIGCSTTDLKSMEISGYTINEVERNIL